MSNVDKIRKIHIIVCWVYIFLSFRAIINDTEYFLLIFLAFIYSIVSLPLYSVKNKIVSICLAINSILLMSFPILINKFFPESFLTYTVLISVFITELIIFHLIGKDFATKLTNEYKKISQFRSKVSQSPWIKYLEISSFILTIFPSILYGTVDNRVLALIFLIKICVDTTIKFLFIRLFDTSTLMKRRIFFLFALDVIAYLFLGYLLVIQKAGYLFSVYFFFLIFQFHLSKKRNTNYLKIASNRNIG